MEEGYTPELLASGQLANSKGTLYTVDTGMRAIIDSVVYHNTTGGALDTEFHIHDGTSRRYDFKSVAANSRYICVDKNAPLYLDAADILQGNAASATSVNYFIFGRLEQKG